MMTHEKFTKKLLQNAEVQKEYDALDEEFALFDELLKARVKAGMTQAEVAIRLPRQKRQPPYEFPPESSA